MKRLIRYALILLTAILPYPLMAQKTTEELKKQINEIKKSSTYLYGEATAETDQDAKDLAEEILYEEINKWAATKKSLRNKEKFIVQNRKELLTEVSLPRGNMHRYFVYVKKSDISGAENTEVIENSHPEMLGQSTVEQIPTDEGASLATYPEVVQTLAQCTEYNDFVTKLKQFSQEGKVGHYARYADINNDTIYYFAVYNREGKILAILSPGSSRKNVKTGRTETLKGDYHGNGAIGFIVK